MVPEGSIRRPKPLSSSSQSTYLEARVVAALTARFVNLTVLLVTFRSRTGHHMVITTTKVVRTYRKRGATQVPVITHKFASAGTCRKRQESHRA
jgi:hypothetical protein